MVGRLHPLFCGVALAGLAATGPAQSADGFVGSSFISGGFASSRAVCYFTNLGNTSITIRNFRISVLDEPEVPLFINECGSTAGATLGPGRSCGIAVRTTDFSPYACSTETSDKSVTRGNLELRGPQTQAILASQALE